MLLLFAPIDKNTLKKLETEKPIFTVGEIGGLLMTVAEAMIGAPGSQCHALNTPAKSLMRCLETEVIGDDSGVVAKKEQRPKSKKPKPLVDPAGPEEMDDPEVLNLDED